MPGAELRPSRLVPLMERAVSRCRLDLSGRAVVTEAATGAYASTALLAAMAGAEVTALVRPTAYGSVAEVRDWTGRLARAAGVVGRIDVVEELTPSALGRADVLTNSGHLRPLDRDLLEQVPPTAVVPLMMEAWEIGAGRVDLDLDALRQRGLATAGTNERNPAVGVFDFLGVMAVKLLADAGIAVVGSEILLLCDNPFSPYVAATLQACGGHVTVLPSAAELESARRADVVLLSLTPTKLPRLGPDHLSLLAERMPGVVVVQLFGDVDRTAAASLGITCWPEPAPPHGHMGILPSGIGPEPVVRLQAGGLKVAQVLLMTPSQRTPFDLEFLDEL